MNLATFVRLLVTRLISRILGVLNVVAIFCNEE